jgi:cell division protein FtsL
MLAFTLLSDRSTLEDEFERLKLEVWLVVMLALIELSDRSTLDEEFERLRLEV